jgi:uncharacterized protein YggE
MKRTITVSGTGRVTTVPDIADIRLGVAITRPTVAEARAAAAETATRILVALAAAGVERSDIRSASLLVQPGYDYTDGAQRLRGQSVSHQFAVTVRDLEALGRIVDDGLAAGATTLDGVDFRVADPAPAHAQARAAAFRDAKARAEMLAAEASVSLGRVLAIAETEPVGTPRPMAVGRVRLMAADNAPTPIEVGEDEVVVSVSVVFAIG